MTYDPDLFKNKRPSEILLDAAKEALDASGHAHLKKELDQSYQEALKVKPQKKSVSKGHVI